MKYAVMGSRPVQEFLYRFIRVYSWTFRLRVENEGRWLSHLRCGGTVLLCSWHQQFFSAIRYFRKYRQYRPSLMISQSGDGDIIASIAQRTGWHAVRGSSSKDGAPALKHMIERLNSFHLAGHIVDGPKGPAGIVKAGVIRLAHATDAVIVPFYISADRAWYFNSWDKFLLPKPFAKVSLRFGEMIKFSPTAQEQAFEGQRVHLEQTMRPGLITNAL